MVTFTHRLLTPLAVASLAVLASACSTPEPEVPGQPGTDSRTGSIESFSRADDLVPEVRTVDSPFARAVSQYSFDLRRLALDPEAMLKREGADFLRHLVTALEFVPKADAETPAAAKEIREGLNLTLLTPGKSTELTALQALELVSARLLAISRGPYKDAPTVVARAEELDRMVHALLLQGNDLKARDLVVAFRRVGLVYKAIYDQTNNEPAPTLEDQKPRVAPAEPRLPLASPPVDPVPAP